MIYMIFVILLIFNLLRHCRDVACRVSAELYNFFSTQRRKDLRKGRKVFSFQTKKAALRFALFV